MLSGPLGALKRLRAKKIARAGTLDLAVGCVARRHLFVCTNARSSGKPACGPGGGDALLAAVQRLLIARGATDVLVTPCGCLGPCFDGPNAVVYPDGVWYAGLAEGDAPGLVRHLLEGTPLAGKIVDPPGGDGDGGGDGAAGTGRSPRSRPAGSVREDRVEVVALPVLAPRRSARTAPRRRGTPWSGTRGGRS